MVKRLQIITPIVLLLLLIFSLYDHHANGVRPRRTQIMMKAKPQTTQNSIKIIFGFLPKGVAIPPSGPSRRHNDIGLKSSGGSTGRQTIEETLLE
ncbi:protein ida-like 2 [Phtheirospermum japonicum]|uniref:Protein ida-like 2 n=1 Tax=Phtheirospermum japonicum TaxID=374723 RepID=A0A830CTZ7_9LAMI|nr:protein ida-like 2 [Phtheirospermum japonicum]